MADLVFWLWAPTLLVILVVFALVLMHHDARRDRAPRHPAE